MIVGVYEHFTEILFLVLRSKRLIFTVNLEILNAGTHRNCVVDRESKVVIVRPCDNPLYIYQIAYDLCFR